MGTVPRVIVVGAGLAGLACGRQLSTYNIAPLILEASDAVGGRVRTDVFDGYRLDRGFQVLLTGYPEAKRLLNYRTLGLKPFHPGACIQWQSRIYRFSDPLRRPLDVPGMLLGPIGTVVDKLRILRLTSHARKRVLCQNVGGPFTSTGEALSSYGFSDSMIQRFLRPFLSGVFLEKSLTTPSWIFEQVWAAFSHGAIALPHEGMGAIPRQLANGLSPGSLRLNAKVAEINGTTVTLANGKQLSGEAVVLATDWTAAAALQGAAVPASGRTAVTIYYGAPQPPLSGPWLLLNGESEGPINHLCVLSEAVPSYAPAGRSLVAVSVRAEARRSEQEEPAVRRQLMDWFGSRVGSWRHLRTDRIASALPPVDLLRAAFDRPSCEIRPGLYRCGDYLSTGTLDGALWSGRSTADAIAERLGAPVSS